MNQILKKILFFLIIIAIILSACVFNYYIRIQSKLDMEELNQMVEKEIIQYHGKH
jgi:NADH:ubiquinone oxidoreductase subunit 2 (subunit N)